MILGHGDISSEKLERSHREELPYLGVLGKVLCKLYVFFFFYLRYLYNRARSAHSNLYLNLSSHRMNLARLLGYVEFQIRERLENGNIDVNSW